MNTRASLVLVLLLGVSASVAAQELPTAAEPGTQEAPPTAAQAMPASAAAPVQAEPAVSAQVEASEPQQQLVEGPRMVRNLVVPQFEAPPTSRARAAVLRTLADHTEVEVVAIDDVTFAARRLQADPNTPEGREKLSRELGIDAWLDGKVTESAAQLTLTAGDGTVLQEVEVEVEDERTLDTRTGQQMWAALGPSLSLQEAYRRAMLAEYERARRKLEARLSEGQRQVELAHKARAHRAFVLRGQFSLAQRKQAALEAERTRQTEVGKAGLAREAEQARQAQLAREAEAKRKVELARKAEEDRKAEAARRREQAKALAKAKAAAKAEAKEAAAQAKAGAKAAAAQARADAKAGKSKTKGERADRAQAKRKRHRDSTSLTNTGAQRAQARAAAKRKKAHAKQAEQAQRTQL